MTTRVIYGYFGKLPFAGDFLRHGLPPDTVSAWDAWVQATLLRAEAIFGTEAWQGVYLSAPIWRFALAPGLCGHSGLAGIVMPSLDRVGRRFPLCLATRTDLPPLAANLALQPVADRLEALALVMIEEGATLDALTAQLAALPDPAEVPAIGADHPGSVWVAAGTDRPEVMLCPGLPDTQTDIARLFAPDAACETRDGGRAP